MEDNNKNNKTRNTSMDTMKYKELIEFVDLYIAKIIHEKHNERSLGIHCGTCYRRYKVIHSKHGWFYHNKFRTGLIVSFLIIISSWVLGGVLINIEIMGWKYYYYIFLTIVNTMNAMYWTIKWVDAETEAQIKQRNVAEAL